MRQKILNSLNKEQNEAVFETEGPVLILAGAGSGKTRVLTYKVAYLISEKNIPAENILMVTFTNKAAREMKDRLEKLTGIQSSKIKNNLPVTSTYHSFCARILRREGKHLGISANFVIYDDLDTKEAISQAMEKLSIDKKSVSPQALAATIANAKNELISYSEYQQMARGFFQETAARVYPVYQNILRENSALDFEDLIYLTVELFRKQPLILSYYQQQFRYILVDEFQDTNRAQYILTQMLAQKSKNITVVGDASQSIYAWRGADFRNILNFKKDYMKVKIFNLEKNYRSTQIILDAANAVISKNKSHPVLNLWTDKISGERITVYNAANEHDEANFIINNLDDENLSGTAILYRTNAQSRIIEEGLLHQGIPYELVGGTRFYERKEIKDVLAYIRLYVNTADSVSLKRARKIGKRRTEDFFKLKESLNNKSEPVDTLTLLDKIVESTKYLSLYDKNNPEELARLENIKELRSVADEFPKINEFLETVALIEKEYSPDHPALKKNNQKVTLMTLHAAKGLEFERVFIIGMEEGLFPHSMSLFDQYELEEERRLCYVGITRAKNKLFLTYARRRLYFGQRMSNMISRFINELPENLTETINNFI